MSAGSSASAAIRSPVQAGSVVWYFTVCTVRMPSAAAAARRVDEEVAAGLDDGQRDDLRLLLAKVSDTLAP